MSKQAIPAPTAPIIDPYQPIATVPVQDVVVIATGQRVTINVSDYNPAIHSSPGKARTPAGGDDNPSWHLDPANGGSTPIQITLISGGATAVIWSSQFNAGLHSNPKYMATIQTAAGVIRLDQNGKTPVPFIPGPFGQEGSVLGPSFAINTPSRALLPWNTNWPLPSSFKCDYEVGGGAAALT